jgi:hypothetical protein
MYKPKNSRKNIFCKNKGEIHICFGGLKTYTTDANYHNGPKKFLH